MVVPDLAKPIQQIFDSPDLVQTVASSVATTIMQFTHTSVKPGTPAVISQRPEREDTVAGAVIRFDGTPFSFVLYLGLPRKRLFQFYANVFNQSLANPADGQDIVGEILNVSFGDIDPRLKAKGFKLKSSFPISFSGASLNNLKSKLPQEYIEIPFDEGENKFFLEIIESSSIKFDWKYTVVKR